MVAVVEFRGARGVSLVVAAAVVVLTGCAAAVSPTSDTRPQPSPSATAGRGRPVEQSPPDAGTPILVVSRRLEPRAFAAAIAEPDRIVINVHVPFEGSIAGTDTAIPFDRIRAGLAGLPADRGTPLALYCKSGRMSALAALELGRLGYRDVVELDGGMQAWTRAGLPLNGGPAPAR